MSPPVTTPSVTCTTRRPGRPRRTWHRTRRAAVLCLVLSAVPLGPSVAGAPRPPDAATVARQMLFTASLEHFVSVANSPRRDPRLDWTSDGCSAPLVGSTGASFDFTDSCRRHDFGYRNLQHLDSGRHWNSGVRRRVDDQFRNDMRSSCIGPWSKRSRCLAWSEIFYQSVRIFSGN